MAIRLTTYEHAKDIPELPGTNVFHSTDLFRILEQTPGYRPVLLVAFEGDKPIGKLLCITRRNFRLLGFTEKHTFTVWESIFIRSGNGKRFSMNY